MPNNGGDSPSKKFVCFIYQILIPKLIHILDTDAYSDIDNNSDIDTVLTPIPILVLILLLVPITI